jgi:hypothetical protein
LDFHCRVELPRPAGALALGVEVIVLNRVQQAWRDFTTTELASGGGSLCFEVTAELGLDARNEGRFEFRFFSFGGVGLAIDRVALTALPQTQPPPVRRRQWRLPGRQRARRQAGRPGEAMARRWEPAGCFLYGAWRLPRGTYLASFAARCGAPRHPGLPVLGVELFGHSRWRSRTPRLWLLPSPDRSGTQLTRRDFTAAELASGTGAVMFEAPPSLSLDGGSDAPFEIRFQHMGNADIAVSAVILQQLTPDEIGSIAASEWRIAGWRRHRLRLPEGCYSLSLEDAADGAAAEPLHVEIAARDTLRWKLPGGWPSPVASWLRRRQRNRGDARSGDPTDAIEFEVPAEFSLEAGKTEIEFAFKAPRPDDGTGRIAVIRELPADPAKTSAPLPRRARLTRLVIIGNCQADILRLGMVRDEGLGRKLAIKYHFVTPPGNLYEFIQKDLEECDMLLVQDIPDWDEFPLKQHIRQNAEVISFPSVRFASLWPFDSWNGPGDREAFAREQPNLTFPYLDGLLGRLRREIPDKETRFRAYRSLEVSGVVNIRRLHQLEERRLCRVDRKFSVTIGDFILDNFRSRRIFHTTVRPGREVLDMLLQYVVRQLGIKRVDPLPDSIESVFRNPQVPVHPQVAATLGASWADEATLYLAGGKEVTWETYIRHYIDHYG